MSNERCLFAVLFSQRNVNEYFYMVNFMIYCDLAMSSKSAKTATLKNALRTQKKKP